MKIKSSIYRSYPVKTKPWTYYQEWNQVLFMHWQVPYEVLVKCVPKNLILDDFNGTYWVSLVAFTMNQVKPRILPAVSAISNFHEVNLRTYVKENNQPGVYFLSIEGEKRLSNFIAKNLSGLPYEKANIQRTHKSYSSLNPHSGNSLQAQFSVQEPILTKDNLDIWLTERYCLYLYENGRKYRYEIDHEEWIINKVTFQHLDLNYKIGDSPLSLNPHRIHYSPGVKVIAWGKDKI